MLGSSQHQGNGSTDMMQNVIAFPQPHRAPAPRRVSRSAKTLFIHIKYTTMIVHLAAAHRPLMDEGRVGKSS